jgi:hypothetical protein
MAGAVAIDLVILPAVCQGWATQGTQSKGSLLYKGEHADAVSILFMHVGPCRGAPPGEHTADGPRGGAVHDLPDGHNMLRIIA